MRNILEWKGKVYSVESCATCPARMMGENGKPYCDIRKSTLRDKRRAGAFPHVPSNRGLGTIPCPVYPEGTKRFRPKSERIDKILLHEKPKIIGAIYCSWCGNKINPMTAVIIINDKEPDRIYDRFECLEQYLRTN